MKTLTGPASFVAAFLLVAGVARAQQGAPFVPGGVEVDGQGVLHSRSTTSDPRLAELWRKSKDAKKDEHVLYISLPRLLDEARRCREAGTPVPDAVRYVGGLVRLQYIFVHPEEKDLVIAGPAEPFDPDPFRPLGKITGRPVLQLDDIVAALRACASGRGGPIGCDLRITPEIADRIRKKTEELKPRLESIGASRAAALIAEAAGNQPVSYFGVEQGTRYAFVCIESDYRLKQVALGLYDPPVRKMKSWKEIATKAEQPHRWVFESTLDRLFATPDGNAFELKGCSLKVNTGLAFATPGNDAPSEAAKKFVALCNENLEELARHIVSWADMINLADLAVLGALCAQDGLAQRIGWDLPAALSAHKMERMATPTSAPTLTIYRQHGGYTIFTSGGVLLDPAGAVKNRAQDEKETLKPLSRRPPEGWSVSHRK